MIMLQYIGKESVPRELNFIQTLKCRSYLFRDIMANIDRTRTSLYTECAKLRAKRARRTWVPGVITTNFEYYRSLGSRQNLPGLGEHFV